MLVDLFHRRYRGNPLLSTLSKEDAKSFLVQAFRILSEDLVPYYVGGETSDTGKAFWHDLNGHVSRELGLMTLGERYQSWNTHQGVRSRERSALEICQTWVLSDPEELGEQSFSKRLSFLELGFRRYAESLARNAKRYSTDRSLTGLDQLAKSTGVWDTLKTAHNSHQATFAAAVDELNHRMRSSGLELHYRNGFIQGSADQFIEQELGQPFWNIVADPIWENVDIDMKEAIDRRDNGGRDPAFYAARALESAIKIISSFKSATHGGEKGPHSYIDNLAGKKQRFIEPWEGQMLKAFFTNVRNPLGHGPGEETMPELSKQQTDWSIAFAICWIRSLIERL